MKVKFTKYCNLICKNKCKIMLALCIIMLFLIMPFSKKVFASNPKVIFDPGDGRVTIRDITGTTKTITEATEFTQSSNTILDYGEPVKDSKIEEIPGFNINYDADGGIAEKTSEAIVFRKVSSFEFYKWKRMSPFNGRVTSILGSGTYTFPEDYDDDEIDRLKAIFTENVESNGIAQIILPGATKEGYTFLGWYDSNGNSIGDKGTVFEPDDNLNLFARWELNSVIVTFDANGGEVSSKTKSVTCDELYGTIPTPVRTGYIFNGWYTDKLGGDKITENSIVERNHNHVIYARWTAKTPTVSFDAKGGTINTLNKTVTYDDVYGTLPAPTLEGYIFNGWYTEAIGGVEVTASTKVTKEENHTIYAHWTEKEIYAIYDANGGNIDTDRKLVKYNQEYGELSTPTRKGYIFDGWFLEKIGGNIVTSNTLVNETENHTIYAHWTVKTVEVSFDAKGGTINTLSKTVTFDDKYGEIPTPEYTGHIFDGWYTEENGGNVVTKNTKVTNDEDHTIYAHWTEKEIFVIYNVCGGTVNPSSKTVTHSSTYGELPTPTKSGYTFDGWYSEETSGFKIESNTTITENEDFMIYAHWIINTSTLTIDPNGGKVTVYSPAGGTAETITSSKNYTQNYNTTLSYDTPTKDQAEDTSSSYTITYDMDGGSGSIPNQTAQITKTTTYTFSGWTKSTTFDGTLSEENKKYTYGSGNNTTSIITANYTSNSPTISVEAILLSSTTPTKSGYSFTGWKSSTNNQIYQAGASYTPTGNTTFIAQWEENTVTVSYNANGGTVSPTSVHTNKTVGAEYGELPIPDRTGYAFDGWFTESTGGTRVTSSTTVTNTSNHTLYAHWDINTSTLTINPNGGEVIVYSPTGGTADTITSSKNYTQNYNTGLTYDTPTKSDTTDRSTYYTVTYNLDGGVGNISNQNAIITKITSYTFSGWTKSTSFYGTLTETNRTYTYGSSNNVTSVITANYTSSVSSSVETITLPSITPTLEGYTFAGWKSSTDSQIYEAGANYTPTSNTTMTAQWDKNEVVERTISTDFDSYGYTGMQVGDIVNYDASSAEQEYSYTTDLSLIGKDTSIVGGDTYSTTFKSTDSMIWKVLGVYINTGELVLVSADGTPKFLRLRGDTGFLNAENVLNDISSVYGHGNGATGAKSITYDIIEQFSSFDKTAYSRNDNKINYSTGYYDIIKYKSYNEYLSITHVADCYRQIRDENNRVIGYETSKSSATSSNPAKYRETYYSYQPTTSNNYMTEEVMNTLIYNTSNEKRTYWISSRTTDLYTKYIYNNSNHLEHTQIHVDLKVGRVGQYGVIASETMYSIFNDYSHDSNVYLGGESGLTGSNSSATYKVCPVVTLKSNIKLQKNSNDEWDIVEEEPDTIYVKLYDSGLLTFSSKDEVLDGETLNKDFGEISQIQYKSNNYPEWTKSAYISQVSRIKILDKIYPIYTDRWFLGYDYNGTYSTVEEIENIENLNTKNVVSMKEMFLLCRNLKNLDVSHFDTSNVTNMSNIFSSCKKLTELDVSNFDTSKVTNMADMFEQCNSLTSIDVSNFNTSNVTNMGAMFDGCESLTSLDVSNFDVSKVTQMGIMFAGCKNLTTIDLSAWNTEKLTGMQLMFEFCSKLTSINFGNFNTSNVTDMHLIFDGCTSLTQLDISSFDTSKLTTISSVMSMFSNCTALQTVYIGSKWKMPSSVSTSDWKANCTASFIKK